MADQRLKFLAVLDDKVTGGLLRIKTAADKLGGRGTSASFLGNISAIAVAKGFGLIDSAISGTLGLLGDAVDAAVEEEQSIAKLDAALRANVKGWDGNRDAIEKVLSARMKLGFSDDEQRESLALLVAATHDETRALDLQRTAMDLARLKRIDLKTASEALVKVEGGQFRLLKGLGIELKKNATQQDALNAVQAVATGQADAFAKGGGGRMLAAQIKIGESLEKIGTKLLPLVADALVGLADAVGPVIDTFADWIDTIGDTIAVIDLLHEAIERGKSPQEILAERTVAASKAIYDEQQAMIKAAGGFDAWTKKTLAAQQAAKKLGAGLDEESEHIVKTTRTTMESIASEIDSGRDDVDDALERLQKEIETGLDPIAERARLLKISRQIADEIANGTPAVKAKALAVQEAVNARLSQMARDAVRFGSQTGSGYAGGLASQIPRVEQAAKNVAKAVTKFLKVSSPAEAGPLSEGGGPEGMGARGGMLYAKGWERSLATIGESLNTALGGGPNFATAGPGIATSRTPIGAVRSPRARRDVVFNVNGREFARATIPDYDEEDYWRGQAAGGATMEA